MSGSRHRCGNVKICNIGLTLEGPRDNRANTHSLYTRCEVSGPDAVVPMPSFSRTGAPKILAAAERCFVRSGFHQTSMQEICAEAGMSPGNLYRYFPSKEALIAGISERNRTEAAAELSAVSRCFELLCGLGAAGPSPSGGADGG